MRITFKTSALAAAVFALASVGAYAQNQTTTIGLSATISSFDNISCDQPTVDLNGGTAITTSGLTTGQAVTCSVTSNDATAVNITAYLPISSPLTGTNPSNTIASTAIEWSTTSGGSYTPFAALTGDLSADVGAQVATAVATGTNTPVDFYLALDVPPTQAADTYNAVMTVAITPGT